MEILNSQVSFIENEEKFLNSSNEETVIAVLNDTEIVWGSDNSCNIEWCKNNNIKTIRHEKLKGGGCIVGVKGNIFIDAKRKIGKDNKCISDKFSIALCEFLKSKGLNSVRQDNNDILVNDYKVASGVETKYNEWQYMGYQISINQNIDIIKNACLKPMVKVPKGLGEYGITTEEMVKFCEDYWSNN